MCSENRNPVNRKERQKPVSTEHKATSLPWGDEPSPWRPLGLPKKRASAGTRGRSTFEPSTASKRKRSFHRIVESNRCWYRIASVSQRVRQNFSRSWRRAKQKASSVTHWVRSQGQAPRANPQAWTRPWVMEQEQRPTYIINQATTSGMSTRLRWGAQPVLVATSEKSWGVRIARKGPSPNCCKSCRAVRRGEPIDTMSKPPCKPDGGWSSMTTRAIRPVGYGRLF